MIADLFLKILNLSIGAVPIMAALLVLRLLFKKAVPRKVFYIAWVLVFLRLMVPFSLESNFSFFNFMPRAEVVEENIGTSVVFVENENARVEFPVFINPERENPNVDMPYHSAITGEIVTGPDITTVPMDKNQIYGTVWIFGTAALLLFGIIGYFAVLGKLKAESISYTDKVSLSEFFKTPVVCGLIRPKIILPMNFDLDDEAKIKSVISHECTHIRRGDNLWRLLATFTLYVHWFNPLVWICYNAFIRDMEVSCDEAVLSGAKNDIRTEYAESLVALAGNGTNPLYGGVLSFGECAVKERVKCIMNFKKTTLMIIILCVAAIAALGVIFLTNPSVLEESEQSVSYETFETENSKSVYSKENGLEIEVTIKNTDEKTIWLGPATYIYSAADGNKSQFIGVYNNGGVLMIRKGDEALFCDSVPAEKFHESVRAALPAGEYILEREVFFDEGLTPTKLYADFRFEIKEEIQGSVSDAFFTFEIPHLSDFSNDKLPLSESEKWCVNNGAWVQNAEVVQFVSNDKISVEMAETIGLVMADNSFNVGYDEFTEFSDIKKANPKELLFSAILKTPKISLKTFHGGNNEASADSSYNNRVVQTILSASDNGFAITEAYYAEDVEKTFRYLFGDKAVFEPQNIENERIRYIPEAEIFVSDVEERMSSIVYPQILSYAKKGGVYYVDAVMTYVWEYASGDEYIIEYEIFDPERPGMTITIKENNAHKLWDQQIYRYALKQNSIGRFIVAGIDLSDTEGKAPSNITVNENPGSEGTSESANAEYLIPDGTEPYVTLFNNASKTAAKSYIGDELRGLLTHENIERIDDPKEAGTSSPSLGKSLTTVDTIEFINKDDGKKYTLSLYEKGFVLSGSAPAKFNGAKITVEENTWEYFINKINTEFENADYTIPYWFGLVSPKRVKEVVVFGENGEKYSYTQKDDTFDNFFSIFKSDIKVSSLEECFDGNKITENLSGEYIRVKIYFETGTVYEIIAERDYITMVSSDMNYGLRYVLEEKADAYDAFLDYAEGGPINAVTG